MEWSGFVLGFVEGCVSMCRVGCFSFFFSGSLFGIGLMCFLS